MIAPGYIQAALFDMDGTLIDSELNTEPAIVDVCQQVGIDKPDIDFAAFYGRTWESSVVEMAEAYPALADVPDIARRFHQRFHELCGETPPPPIPGAREFIVRLSESVPVAIVSSAYRESIAQTIEQLDIARYVRCYVGAEDFGASKPAPDCFLHAASILEVEPARCLVFEDSIAGLTAGRAAGMTVGAILHRSNDLDGATAIADIAIQNYTELAEDFVDRVCDGRGSG